MDPFIEIQQRLRIQALKEYTDTELITELRDRGLLVICNGKDPKEVAHERDSDRCPSVPSV